MYVIDLAKATPLDLDEIAGYEVKVTDNLPRYVQAENTVVYVRHTGRLYVSKNKNWIQFDPPKPKRAVDVINLVKSRNPNRQYMLQY